MILLVHIIAGGLGLITGYVALSAAKGASLHRKSGMLFVCVMSVMAITAMLISAVEGVAPAINVPSALLTFYLVITSLITVRPAAGASTRWRPCRSGSRSLDAAAMLMAFAIAAACAGLGVRAIAKGGAAAGMAFPLFVFGGVALAAGVGDLRMIRDGGVRGPSRLKRHLWRMCFALLIASIAFYPRLGRIEGFPKPLVALPVLAVLAIMFYWLWHLRVRQHRRILDRVTVPDAI